MRVLRLTLPALLLCWIAFMNVVEPQAQQYTIVHSVRDLDDPAKAVCVAMSKNPLESFHYASQVIVGNDMLVRSRSSVGGNDGHKH